MNKKRTFNQIDNIESNNKQYKKAKLDNIKNEILDSEIFTHSADKQQYSIIFQSINESEWIRNNNVERNLIKIITEYSTGQLIQCYLCREQMSFLEIECENKTIKKCVNCHSKNWYGNCDIHYQQKCSGPLCEDCRKCICAKLVKECDQCLGAFCVECFPNSLGDKCWDCALPNGHYS